MTLISEAKAEVVETVEDLTVEEDIEQIQVRLVIVADRMNHFIRKGLTINHPEL